MIRRLLAALALIATLCSAPALAWGGFGHRTTAEIALANVKPETAARIRALIAVNKQLGTPSCHLHNLAEAATWPDCLRKEQWRWGFTAPWHFQNANICKPFDPKADCANGNCVSAQIERNFRLLSDRSLPAVQRLEAMAFLVHFVGDIHQPLHSSDAGDYGGGGIKGSYGIAPGESLHTVWDSALAERAISSALPPLVRRYTPAERAAQDGGTAADWGRESWDIARTVIYPRALKGADPCASGMDKTAIRATQLAWGEEDTAATLPIVRQRIVQAGLRIARLLDEALSGSAQPGRRVS